MDVIKAPVKIERPIYKAGFSHIPVHGTKATTKFNEKEIQDRLEGNIIEIGEPEYWNIKKLLERQKKRLPVDMEMTLEKSDFWLIRSCFTFMPAHDNRFNWGRIVVNMEQLSENIKNPIAYDVYPRNIYNEKKGKHKISLGINLKFAEIVESKMEYVQDIEFTSLEPIITVAGIGKSKPTWDFRDEASFNLKNVNSLYIIVKIPIGSDGIVLSYFLNAHISNKILGIIPAVAKKLEGEENYEIKF